MICESGIANGEVPAGWSCTEVASARSGRPRYGMTNASTPPRTNLGVLVGDREFAAVEVLRHFIHLLR
jgi:hypothetical protein